MIGFCVCTLFLLFQMQGVTMKNTLMLQRVKEEIPAEVLAVLPMIVPIKEKNCIRKEDDL